MDRILREMTRDDGGAMQPGALVQGQGQAKGTSATSPLCDVQVLLSLDPNVSRPQSRFVTLNSVWRSAQGRFTSLLDISSSLLSRRGREHWLVNRPWCDLSWGLVSGRR